MTPIVGQRLGNIYREDRDMALPALQFQCTLHKVLKGITKGHPEWNYLDQQSMDAAMTKEVAECIEGHKIAKGIKREEA